MSLNLRNKPSFCSGSCNECYAKKNCTNKLHSWNTLETWKFLWNFPQTTFELLSNTHEVHLKLHWNTLQSSIPTFIIDYTSIQWEAALHSIFHETPIKLLWNPLETSLKHPENFLEMTSKQTPLKYIWNFPEILFKLVSITLESHLKLQWSILQSFLKLP